MFQRSINLPKNHSFFLFGPRGVGKTTLLKTTLPPNQTYVMDLLDYELETELIGSPRRFRQILEGLPPSIRWIVVDEVQKLPFLLDEVHREIEKSKERHFALTGSSARKLKRGRANLLAGRAFTYTLAPLTRAELGEAFDLNQALAFGTLPEAVTLKTEEEKNDYLRSYARTYLREEVQAEGIIRNLQAFRRFLPIAAAQNGQILSWSNFAQDTGIDAKTARSYFEILEETLLGFLLPAFHRSLRKRQKTHPKFYLFDPGVKRALAGELNRPLFPGTDEFGRAFEHFFLLEILRANEYRKADYVFSYFATHDVEIDLVVERPDRSIVFVEFKSSERVRDTELHPLFPLVGEVKQGRGLCICRELRKRKVENVLVCPWQEALEELFS